MLNVLLFCIFYKRSYQLKNLLKFTYRPSDRQKLHWENERASCIRPSCHSRVL